MNDVTHILSRIEAGDPSATEQLLPLVYDELRRLAAQRLAREKPGQTLEATALVHEAFLRLAATDAPQPWNGRGHFFGVKFVPLLRWPLATYAEFVPGIVEKVSPFSEYGKTIKPEAAKSTVIADVDKGATSAVIAKTT